MSQIIRTGLMIAALGWLLQPALAQQPERTVSSYGNWELRCDRILANDTFRESCEVVQTIQVQGRSEPLTRLAFGRPEGSDSFLIVLQLPVGLWLPEGASLEFSEDARYEATFRRCLPNACLADLVVEDEIIEALSDEADESARIVFAMQEANPTRVPILPRGFAAAYDALQTKLQSDD